MCVISSVVADTCMHTLLAVRGGRGGGRGGALGLDVPGLDLKGDKGLGEGERVVTSGSYQEGIRSVEKGS